MDGIGKPRSHGKYEIFDDEREAPTSNAAEKRAHDQLREMGIPVQQYTRPQLIQRTAPTAVEERVPTRVPRPVHKSLEESTLPAPPFTMPKSDHKLEAIARAHILLHYLKDSCCKEHPEHIG